MKKEEVRLPPAPQKDRLRAVFFMEKEGVGSKRKGKTLRAFRSSARRLVRRRTGHRRFLSAISNMKKSQKKGVLHPNAQCLDMCLSR